MEGYSSRLRGSSRVVVAVAVLSLTLAACRSSAGDTSRSRIGGSSWRALFDDGEANVLTFVMGFMDDDIPSARQAGSRTYSVPADEPLSMTYHGLSSLPEPVYLRVTLLVDLQQVPFMMDGEEGLLHDVSLETQVIRDIPIVIPPLAEGAHDVIWLPFLSPDNHSADEEFRRSWTYSNADRFTLLAGEAQDWAARDWEPLSAFEEPEDFAESYPWAALVTDEAEAMAEWYEAEVGPGERLDYYVFTGYRDFMSPTDPTINTFAFLVFLDYQSIPLVAGDDRLVRFFSLDAGTAVARIEASLVAPEEVGSHELCVLRVDNVGRSVDELSCEECNPHAIFPYLDGRTLITVR